MTRMMPSVAEPYLPPPTRRILLVDDNPEIHKDIMGILRPRLQDPLAIVEADLFGDVPGPEGPTRLPNQY